MNDPSSALAAARAAAHTLIGDLANAAQQTQNWSNPELAYPLVRDALDRCLSTLCDTGLWGEDNRMASGEFWRIAGDVLRVGQLQLRARTKPRGYAGDYQMLDMICREQCCDDPLGRLFDRYFQEQQAPGAVRNRTQLVATAIAGFVKQRPDQRCRLASIGSGPAIDVHHALTRLPASARGTCEICLIDVDPDALDAARTSLLLLLPGPEQLTCVRENLFRLAGRLQSATQWQSVDFIACTGLFDYLNDDDAARLLAAMWHWLAPRGQAYVFNFAPDNPTRAYMEWIGNWYLTYRNRDDMIELARRAELSADAFEIDAEGTGVNLFLRIKKSDDTGV